MTPLSVIQGGPATAGHEGSEPLTWVRLALADEDFDVAATALANALAREFGCAQAAIGLIAGSTLRLAACSDASELRAERGPVRQLVAAMEEVADQHGSLRYPPQDADPPRILLMHADLAESSPAGAVLSVPLVAGRRVSGVLTLRRRQAWSDAERDRLEQVATTLGPLLALRAQAAESLPAQLRRRLHAFGQRLRGPGALATKLLSLLLLLAVGGAFLFPIADTVSAPARLEGVVQRSIVAPADSFIQEVLVRPGAFVENGQLLLRLSDTDLRNEQLRLESELARFRGEQAEAFARQDRSRMVIAQSRGDEVAAQLALVMAQLERTQLTAPFDGVVIRGDLEQQAGAPVKRGDVLLVLAPSGDYRLLLQVDERDIARVAQGDGGEVAFSALPGRRFEIRVERITPVAGLQDGRNSFAVEASLRQDGEGLRPGLEGVARIAQGQRPLALIWGQRLLDWASFRLWALFG